MVSRSISVLKVNPSVWFCESRTRGVRAPLCRIFELGGEEGVKAGSSGEGELDRVNGSGVEVPLVAAIEGEDGGSGDLVK